MSQYNIQIQYPGTRGPVGPSGGPTGATGATGATGVTGPTGSGAGSPVPPYSSLQYNNSGVFGAATIYYNSGLHSTVVNGAVAGAVTFTIDGVSGTHSTKIADATPTVYNAGFLEMPLTVLPIGVAPTYTIVLSDSGKLLYNNRLGFDNITVYIPDNSVVPYPQGTTITIINDNNLYSVTVAPVIGGNAQITALGGIGSLEAPVISPYGGLTLVLVDNDRWFVNGIGYV